MVYLLKIERLNDPARRDDFLDGDTAAIELADKSPEPGLNINMAPTRQYTLGRRIKSDHVPTMLHWRNPSSALADIVKPSGFPCVSDRFKSLIERLEPNSHQFFPLELVNGKRQHIADRWLWVVCQRVDTVDRQHTTLIHYRGVLWTAPDAIPAQEIPADYDRTLPLKVVFNSEQVGNTHFWRDKFLPPNLLYCSEEAAAAIEAEEMSGANLVEQETV